MQSLRLTAGNPGLKNIFPSPGLRCGRKTSRRMLFSSLISYLCSPIFEKAMYAIVNIAGKQFKVAKDQYIYAPKLEGDAGSEVSFDNVLLVEDGSSIDIGAPTVKGIKVSGKILEHVKGNKVIVFKKKRRKGYQVKNGHRQQFTKVQIVGIG